MTNPPTLQDIYLKTAYASPPPGMLYGINLENDAVYQALKDQIHTALYELVGQDDVKPTDKYDHPFGDEFRNSRNSLRADLRTAIDRFCGVDKEKK
jgi:hypothetical protein